MVCPRAVPTSTSWPIPASSTRTSLPRPDRWWSRSTSARATTARSRRATGGGWAVPAPRGLYRFRVTDVTETSVVIEVEEDVLLFGARDRESHLLKLGLSGVGCHAVLVARCSTARVCAFGPSWCEIYDRQPTARFQRAPQTRVHGRWVREMVVDEPRKHRVTARLRQIRSSRLASMTVTFVAPASSTPCSRRSSESPSSEAYTRPAAPWSGRSC